MAEDRYVVTIGENAYRDVTERITEQDAQIAALRAENAGLRAEFDRVSGMTVMEFVEWRQTVADARAALTPHDDGAMNEGNAPNKALTLAEVLALPDQTHVWVEVRRPVERFINGVYRMRNRQIVGVDTSAYVNIGDGRKYGTVYRVWLNPYAPTVEELAAHPWPDDSAQDGREGAEHD